MRPGAATVLAVLLLTACSGLPGNFKDPTPFGKRKVAFTHEGRAPLVRSGGTMSVPAS
jgi:hypothetical protein